MLLGMHSFRFADASAKRGLTINYSGAINGDQMPEVFNEELTPFLGHTSPGIVFEALKMGPKEAVAVVLGQWPDCKLPHLSLTGDGENLMWLALCETDAGLLSATVDNAGGFHSRWDGPADTPYRYSLVIDRLHRNR